jgi:Transcriptional Coactivator p15 (PC4)
VDTVIAEVQKSTGENLRLALRNYKSKLVIDIRTYSQDHAGDWLPTRKGIGLTVDRWPELQKALAKLAGAMNEPM